MRYDPPNRKSPKLCNRTYLRVLLHAVQEGGPAWLLVLSHIKVGSKAKGEDRSNDSPNVLGTNSDKKKLDLFAAALNQGHKAATELASDLDRVVVCVILGDQNLKNEHTRSN